METIKSYRRLGMGNLARVGLYRLGTRSGLHPVLKLKRTLDGKLFFTEYTAPIRSLAAPNIWRDSALFFGWYDTPLIDGKPAWNRNPFTGAEGSGNHKPWWLLSDFDSPAGDIKVVWEPSRFDWVVTMAQRVALGEDAELKRLNSWLADWSRHNPAFMGPNWKCGQEASIRVLHLAIAARILGQDSVVPGDLINLVEAHLARIHPTLSYALAQDNNHGTSEAAALFIGGLLCEAGGVRHGSQWSRDGRKWLENRVQRLILPDGSFSQHSSNYHRLLLDTLCLAELWRRWKNLPSFSEAFLERTRAATNWLHSMVDPKTGHCPNVGDNDGASLLPLTDADFRDFRPTVQLAMALFSDKTAFSHHGPHDSLLDWLDVARPKEMALPPKSLHFARGGYSILRQGRWMAMLKFPMYKFRPRHCDALHLDLWHDSRNVLRDAGTYSYNTEPIWQEYFPGTAAHNTVEFDGRDQMPTIGRFLRGAWLSSSNVAFNAEDATASAGYTDWKGASHIRRVHLGEEGLSVQDEVGGFNDHAILRWRLEPGEWTINGLVVRGPTMTLNISSSVGISRMEIIDGWESCYYLKKSKIPVLEVELKEAGVFTTNITLNQTEE